MLVMRLFSDCCAAYIPLTLHEEGERVLGVLWEALDGAQQQKLLEQCQSSHEFCRHLAQAILGSQYVLESFCRYPNLLFDDCLLTPENILLEKNVATAIQADSGEPSNVDAFDARLRYFRRRFMVCLYWCDLNKLLDVVEITHAMTLLAEVSIQHALDFHFMQLSASHGVPIGAASQLPQQMLVLGMGKLGGSELNVSSDIDLIFVFPEKGMTDHDDSALDNEQFFSRLGKRVIKSLNESRADGFVFRVDMRLRPYGQSGALVSNFSALEDYYQTQARDWERFAAIKARVVACVSLDDERQSLQLRQQSIDTINTILRPFSYRKYLDFSIIESLRRLKSLILQEVKRKNLQDDIKLGAGGIRELEFIVQSFQLVRGGHDTRLQQRNWLAALSVLVETQAIIAIDADRLRKSYLFLRKVEHVIQAYQDRQTQRLPQESVAQDVLAWAMGADSWALFLEQLDAHRHFVNEYFQQLIAEPKSDCSDPLAELAVEWSQLWLGELDEPALFLKQQSCIDPAALLSAIATFKQSWGVKQLSPSASQCLDILLPQVLSQALILSRSENTLTTLLTWLETIVSRHSYLVLLLENPHVLPQLIPLFENSAWVVDMLTQMPSLLDELIDGSVLSQLPDKPSLRDELRQRLLRLDPDDIEAHVEVLQYFRSAHSLRIAASDLAGTLPLMKISDYLTYIAEIVLDEVLLLAWRQLESKHGQPCSHDDSAELVAATPGFMVVAYGKLGGIELSYSSDLDLVFIYRADAQAMTDGPKPVDYQTFYTRLGQKIIHLLNTRMLFGQLYEVDMRLRPSGNSGLLVSTMTAFERYQQDNAWTWEHQALVRARPIAGDSRLQHDFNGLRRRILSQQRCLPDLRAAVIDMRQKMREHLGSAAAGTVNVLGRFGPKHGEKTQKKPLFHLKQDAGGIVDIEFMVQYAVLAWAHQQPQLGEYTDNIRILEVLQTSGFLASTHAADLIEVYQCYRERSHRLALQKQPSSIPADAFVGQRKQVQDIWQQLLLADNESTESA